MSLFPRKHPWAPAAMVAALALCATSTAARADLVNWEFDIEATSEDDVSWTSSTTLPTGLTEYTYTYEVTSAEVQLGGLLWTPIPDFTASGGGQFGALPTLLLDDAIDDEATGNAVDVQLGIDADGRGYASLTNITFGTFGGGLDVTGVRFTGNVQIVPEPATTALLVLGGVAAALRRPNRLSRLTR